MSRKRKPSGRKLPDKGRRSRRRPIMTRELRQRFLIVCEGEKTEPNYFRSFRVHVDVKVIGTGKDTTDVVEYANRLQKEAARRAEAYDQVWAVFDRDDFSAEKFNRAIQVARNKGILAAYSNPSFELWFLLHFDDRQSPITRRDCGDLLSKRLGMPYRKNQVGLRNYLLHLEEQAIERAERLCNSYPQHNPAKDNPCTAVYQLVKELNRHSR